MQQREYSYSMWAQPVLSHRLAKKADAEIPVGITIKLVPETDTSTATILPAPLIE